MVQKDRHRSSQVNKIYQLLYAPRSTPRPREIFTLRLLRLKTSVYAGSNMFQLSKHMSIIVNMSLCQSAISTPFIQKHRILVTDCKLRCCLFNWWMARVLPWLGPSAQENQIKLVFTVEIQLLTASDELEACNRPDSSGWNHVASHKWQVATISSKRWIHKARKGL